MDYVNNRLLQSYLSESGGIFMRLPIHCTVVFALAFTPLIRAEDVDTSSLTTIHFHADDATAASAFVSNWRMMFGHKLKTGTGTADRKGIFIGLAASRAAGLITDIEIAEATPGGYVIKCTPDHIAIAGPHIYATSYGVNGFFEKQGALFYERVSRIPKMEPTFPAFELVTKPKILFRNYSTRIEWAECRKGLNPELFAEDSDLWIDHSAGYLIPKKLFYDEHPEYFAMLKNGERIPKNSFTDHRTPLCLSNPDVTRISIERALGWVENEKNKIFFPVTYGDTGAWCQCEPCKKLDPVPGQYSTRLLKWVNPVARAIGEKYPDKIILTFAYGGSDAPPPTERPEKNVWICGSAGYASFPFWDHSVAANPKAMEGVQKKIDGWLAIVPEQTSVCEYLSQKYYPSMPDFLAGRIRHHAKKGLRGVMFTFGNPDNFKLLCEYLSNALMWEPDQDVMQLTRQFARAHFGKASEPMIRYFELAHERYQSTLKEGKKPQNRYPEDFYTNDFSQTALKTLWDAINAADNPVKAELSKETRMFILDWMEHPISKELTPESTKALLAQLQGLFDLAGDDEKMRVSTMREIHRVAFQIDSVQKGALPLIEKWLREKFFPEPSGELIPGGIHLPSRLWMFDGWGPKVYQGHEHAVPPRVVVAVYVEGNSAKRSHHMEAHFSLAKLPGDGGAKFEIEGADCDHDVDTSEIRIEINGTPIFEGQVLTVKHNWSRQTFQIKPGLLKVGKNKVEIINACDPKSIKNWYERWFMLSDAKILFTDA